MLWKRTKKKTDQSVVVEVPLLARVWQEDEVWNISAFDLPIVVFGDNLNEARERFEEAIQSHFLALNELHQLESEAHRLVRLARHSHYLERIPQRELVERFDASTALSPIGASRELCRVG